MHEYTADAAWAGNFETPASTFKYDLKEQRECVKADLLAKFAREDWHGVADAAMDLRDIDAFAAGKRGDLHP